MYKDNGTQKYLSVVDNGYVAFGKLFSQKVESLPQPARQYASSSTAALP